MSKMQNLKFHSMYDLLEYLPENEQKLVTLLRQVVLSSIPECEEKLAYNVPFYYRHARICYIWPGAVPWGNVKNEGVQFGFCNGYLLQDDINYLDKGNRKQVYVKLFASVSEVDTDLLKTFIYDAVEVDEELKRNKRKQ